MRKCVHVCNSDSCSSIWVTMIAIPFHLKHWHKKQLPENSLRSIMKNEHPNRDQEISFPTPVSIIWDFTSIQNIQYWGYIISSQDSKRISFSDKLNCNILKHATIAFYLISTNSALIIIHCLNTKQTLPIIQFHWESWHKWVTPLLYGRCLLQKSVRTMTILMEILVIFLSPFSTVAVCLTPWSVAQPVGHWMTGWELTLNMCVLQRGNTICIGCTRFLQDHRKWKHWKKAWLCLLYTRSSKSCQPWTN
jgi:hypothetical protein